MSLGYLSGSPRIWGTAVPVVLWAVGALWGWGSGLCQAGGHKDLIVTFTVVNVINVLCRLAWSMRDFSFNGPIFTIVDVVSVCCRLAQFEKRQFLWSNHYNSWCGQCLLQTYPVWRTSISMVKSFVVDVVNVCCRIAQFEERQFLWSNIYNSWCGQCMLQTHPEFEECQSLWTNLL